jgi:putative FmdB family regulatory protein
MPLYQYSCDKCHKIFELIILLEYSDMDVLCRYCGNKLEKNITCCMFKV